MKKTMRAWAAACALLCGMGMAVAAQSPELGRLERELARLERGREMIAQPDFFDDVRLIGTLAKIARVRADAGRRGWVRLRWIYGWGCRSWRRLSERAREGAEGALAVARCRCAPG